MPNELIKLISHFPDKPLDWASLSTNPNIKNIDVERYHDKPWIWYWLSGNPGITLTDVEDHPDKAWDWFKSKSKCHNRGCVCSKSQTLELAIFESK